MTVNQNCHLNPGQTRQSAERQFGTQRHAVPEFASETVLDHERFDSLFEQHVFNRIVDRGYAVRPQVPLSGYRIDLVVVGRESQVAVECDGDEFHGPEQYAADIARQRDLERAGMTFFRIRGSKFYSDRQGSLEPLWDLLESHGIHPVTHEPPEDSQSAAPDEDANTATAPTVPKPQPSSPDVELVDAGPTWDDLSSRTRAADGTQSPDGLSTSPAAVPQPSSDPVPRRRADADIGPSTKAAPEEAQEPKAASEDHDRRRAPTAPVDLAAIYQPPDEYEHWDTQTSLPDPNTAHPAERADGLRRIVEVEGPVCGDRLYSLYVKSAGGKQVGSAIRRKLNKDTYQLERQGVLTGDNPLGESGQAAKTFRLPDQPQFHLRELGDRTIHQVPPLELSAKIRSLRRHGDSNEDTFRRVLRAYGLKKLTSKTRQRLEDCAPLLAEDE